MNKRLFVLFTGLADKLGGLTENQLKTKYLEPEDELIMLVDRKKVLYLLGDGDQYDRPALLAEYLQSKIEEQPEGTSIKFVGTSAGGYGAYLYGTLLNIPSVSFSGFYVVGLKTLLLDDQFFFNILPSKARYEHLKRIHTTPGIEGKHMNLKGLRNKLNTEAKAICFYPDKSPQDVIRAHFMKNALHTTIIPIDADRHAGDFHSVAQNRELLRSVFYDTNESRIKKHIQF